MTTAAFQETLGWGAGGKAGLKKHKGFTNANNFWKAVVTKFRLADRKKRDQLRKD